MKFTIALLLAIVTALDLAPKNFQQAKEIMHKRIYTSFLQKDYYCGCLYTREKRVNLTSCGYTIRKNANRASRIEWEHVVPASFYGKTLACWKHKGRKNCGEKSFEFRKFESDMHNLRPVIGELNGDRSNLFYGITSTQYPATYGQCKFKIDFQTNFAEPPDEIKGDLARITLYVSEKYKLPFSEEYIRMLRGWAKRDPVSDVEKIINDKIKFYQGDSNYYIDGSKKIE